MPGDHCFRLDDGDGRTPATPELREPGPEHPICDAQLCFVAALRTLKDQELVAEDENLRVKRRSGAKALPNRVEQREDDREHVARNVSKSSRKFNWLNQYRVFGRDRSIAGRVSPMPGISEFLESECSMNPSFEQNQIAQRVAHAANNTLI